MNLEHFLIEHRGGDIERGEGPAGFEKLAVPGDIEAPSHALQKACFPCLDVGVQSVGVAVEGLRLQLVCWIGGIQAF